MSSIPPYPGSDSAGRPEDGSSANPGAWSAPQQAQGSPAQYGQASPYDQPGQQDQQDQPGQKFPAGPQTQPAAASGPAPGTDLGSDLGSSVSWMWSAFARNVAAFLVPAIIWSVAVFVIVGVAVTIAIIVMVGMMQDAPTSSDEVPAGALVALYGITLASVPFAWIIALLWQSGAVRAAETVRTGGRPVLGGSFVGPGRVILTALLVGIMVGIGTLILVIPGLVLGVFSFYALPAAARGASPVQAIKESFSLVKNNFGLTVLAYVITMAASSIAGSIVIGSILLLPLLVLFQFGLYERVNGRRLTEPVRA